MIRIKYPLFIGKNRKYVYPRFQSPFFWKGFRVGFCPPSSALRPLSSLLCLLSIVFLLSCVKSPVREQLERAEQVMETDSRAASDVISKGNKYVLFQNNSGTNVKHALALKSIAHRTFNNGLFRNTIYSRYCTYNPTSGGYRYFHGSGFIDALYMF
ncbi:MAG: hypothetical protein J5698_03650 [Bacteroidaceae bacterium]|nr:hypothetical protein [Bacteroidaceae bacterium]